MKIFYLLIISILYTTCALHAQSERRAIRFLQKADKALLKSQTLSYKANLQIKEAMQYDTLKIEGAVNLRRNKSDVFFGYDLCVETAQMTSFYTLGKSYRIDHINKKVYPDRFIDPSKTIRASSPFNQGQNDLLFDYLLHPDSAFSRFAMEKNYVFNKAKNGFLNDTIIIIARDITGQTIWNTDTLNNFIFQVYLDRKTKMPIKIVRKGLGRWSDFYIGLQILHNNLPQDSIDNFFNLFRWPKNYQLINTKEVSNHKAPDAKQYIKSAPEFELSDYQGKSIRLSDLKGKVVVLDFWYSTCAPCLKASKYLEGFVKEFADSNLVVLGMNPVDNIPRIAKHYEKWNLNYNTLVCSNLVKNDFEVSSYPTFLVIDKNGIIIYKNSGFSPAIMHEIESAIKAAIR